MARRGKKEEGSNGRRARVPRRVLRAVEFSFLSDQSPALQEVHIPPTETSSELEARPGEEGTMRENGGDLAMKGNERRGKKREGKKERARS